MLEVLVGSGDEAVQRDGGVGGDDGISPPQPIGKTSNGGRERDAHPLAGLPAEPLEELARVPVLPAQPLDVRRVGGQRVDALVEGVGGVDAVLAPRASRRPRPAGRRPRARARRPSCSGKTQRLPASRTASSTARPVAMWSAWLSLRPPQVSRKLPVITISGRCRRTTARDLAPQRHAVLEDAVGLAEELDDVDADDPRRLDLLGLADAAALVGVHRVDAGLAGGDHAVDDLLALAGPARDGGGGAELHVVGVRDDRERAGPVLGQRFERWWRVHGAEHAANSAWPDRARAGWVIGMTADRGAHRATPMPEWYDALPERDLSLSSRWAPPEFRERAPRLVRVRGRAGGRAWSSTSCAAGRPSGG